MLGCINQLLFALRMGAPQQEHELGLLLAHHFDNPVSEVLPAFFGMGRGIGAFHCHCRIEQQNTLLTGKGTEEHLSLVHSWLGHLLYIAVQRIKRLARGSVAFQELRQNTLRLICRARRALVNVWRRYVDTKRIGFKGPELWAFRTGYDEAELFAGHTSRAEMRAAFDYASDMCKSKAYKIIEGSYQR